MYWIRSKIVTDKKCCHNVWRNVTRHSFDFSVKNILASTGAEVTNQGVNDEVLF